MESWLKECLAQNEVCEKKVGRYLVMRMYNDHNAKEKLPNGKSRKEVDLSKRGPHYQLQEYALPPAIICQLDGAWSIIHNRNPFDAVRNESDLLNEPVANL